MFRYDRVSITVPSGDLEQEVWTFWWFDDSHLLRLDLYQHFFRNTKRHKWIAKDHWSRYNGRGNTIDRPSIPLWIQAQAKSDFIAQFSAGLKVEA